MQFFDKFATTIEKSIVYRRSKVFFDRFQCAQSKKNEVV